MSNLVYLMCSLPSLTYGEAPPITMDEFLNEAQSQLSKKSFLKLGQFSLQEVNAGSGKGKLKRFTKLIEDLHNDLSELRTAKWQQREPELINLSKSLMELDPLEREMAIIQWEWDELTDMEVGANFTMTELIVYKLKLELVSRVYSFDKTHGAKVLDSVVNPIQNSEV
ncbi:MAG: hypothetical protein C0599_10770 [Salinivirgaceae bacterium]|nr:MAG: hypothetical protein C0599_10770 [Salinivirgaceae bacterium]